MRSYGTGNVVDRLQADLQARGVSSLPAAETASSSAKVEKEPVKPRATRGKAKTKPAGKTRAATNKKGGL